MQVCLKMRYNAFCVNCLFCVTFAEILHQTVLKMKKIVLTLAALALMAASANAQKTVVRTESFSDTQARMLEVTAKSYVKPLVVDLVVAKGQARKVFKKLYSAKEVVAGMNGNPDNLRSRAVYDATAEWGCDAAVAATFKIELTPDGSAYEVEMKGFPANFDPQSWHPMTKEDFEWLQVDRSLSTAKENDPDRKGAVIKDIKK